MGGGGLSRGLTGPRHPRRGPGPDAPPPAPLVRRPRPTGAGSPDRDPIETLDGTLPPQGYRLEVGEDAVHVVGADDAGLRHGRATLAQLRHRADAPGRRRADGTLPACRIEDWPDFAVRGVMLDVSRDRVPTLETLFALIDRLAGWKINQLQLYMEHTFAYVGHEEVWRHADPYTADDLAGPRRALPVAGRRARGQPEHPRALRTVAAAATATAPWPSPPTGSSGSSGSAAPP